MRTAPDTDARRREFTILAIGLAVMTLLCAAIAWHVRHTRAGPLLGTLAAIYLLGAIHCCAAALLEDEQP